MNNRRIFVHGHRGARARRPENTLPAFRYAIEQGVDFLELDVRITKDNVPVVVHDALIDGIPIDSLTLAELKEYDCARVPTLGVPTLDDVFDLSRESTVQFNVETKIFTEASTRLILDLIRKHGIEQRVMLQSFDPRPLRVMKELEPSIPRGALFEVEREWPDVAREFDPTYFAPLYSLVTKDKVSWAHGAGFKVVTWTVNSPEDWAKLADDGVDAIISDDPALLIAWLKKEGQLPQTVESV